MKEVEAAKRETEEIVENDRIKLLNVEEKIVQILKLLSKRLLQKQKIVKNKFNQKRKKWLHQMRNHLPVFLHQVPHQIIHLQVPLFKLKRKLLQKKP